MRIVQLITQARGGPVDHAVDVALELNRLGHDAHLVGPGGDYEVPLAAAGVAVHRASMTGKADLRGARAVAGALRDLRPAVVHCQDRRAGLVGRVLAARTGTPTVYTLHGVPDSLADLVPGNLAVASATRRDRIANLAGERLLARAGRSVVVTPCDALAGYAREQIGIPERQVVAVHNGVSPRWLRPAMPRQATSTATVAWLGVMQPVKRLPELVRAVAGVRDLRLLLIGDGPERARVEAEIRSAGISDRVELAGFRTDPEALLRASDFAVLPSAAEACPMAMLQAMACGLPIVASRAGGIPEIVRDGVDGILVRTGDDDALRRALERLAGDPQLRGLLGGNARRRVLDRFTVEHCTRELLAVYEEVAG